MATAQGGESVNGAPDIAGYFADTIEEQRKAIAAQRQIIARLLVELERERAKVRAFRRYREKHFADTVSAPEVERMADTITVESDLGASPSELSHRRMLDRTR